jgi:peptide/nickel transport system permease protein
MKNPFIIYIIQRILQCIVVIFIGTTVTFVIPRLVPSTNPVETAIARAQMMGQYTDPKAVDEMRRVLKKLYGLEGTTFQQYIRYWGSVLRGDFGPSFSSFPTPVMTLIRVSLSWTAGLLLLTTILSWIIGTLLGGLAGYFSEKPWARILEIFTNAIRPIPYYIMALLMLILFSYVLPLFPRGGAFAIGLTPTFSWQFIRSVIIHAFLPALSLIVVGIGGWFQNMRVLVSNIIREDYVIYAETLNIFPRDILYKYVIRNAALPQLTGLALQLGMIFSGALITEVVFNYPGLGFLLYTGILRGDYSLIMGITFFSIVAIAVGALIIDLLYPLFDPRVRYT